MRTRMRNAFLPFQVIDQRICMAAFSMHRSWLWRTSAYSSQPLVSQTLLHAGCCYKGHVYKLHTRSLVPAPQMRKLNPTKVSPSLQVLPLANWSTRHEEMGSQHMVLLYLSNKEVPFPSGHFMGSAMGTVIEIGKKKHKCETIINSRSNMW